MLPQEPPPPAPMPAPYPLDEGLESGYAPQIALGDAVHDAWTKAQQRDQLGKDAQGEEEELTGSKRPKATAALVGEGTFLVSDVRPPARDSIAVIVPLRDQPPETVAQRLAGLQPWKAKVVLALMECGGVMGLAATRANVSLKSVEEHMRADKDFALACAEAVGHSTDLVEAAVIRGATIGDLEPIYQGGRLVGYKRRRNTKDAELALTLRGRMPDQQVTVNHQGHVALIRDEDLPARLAELYRLMNPEPKAIEGTVVDEVK